MLIGAIIGAIVGVLIVFFLYSMKEQRFKTIMKTISEPVDYAALYHYASYNRYKKSMKFFDSYGVLYLVDKKLFYKTTPTDTPMVFNLEECDIKQEEDWRMLKWFSITNHIGEKFYFNSQKMGLFKNNSEETLKGFTVLQLKKGK